jgi:hypothetical protein
MQGSYRARYSSKGSLIIDVLTHSCPEWPRTGWRALLISPDVYIQLEVDGMLSEEHHALETIAPSCKILHIQ